MATHIDGIIEKMGYAESSCLKYRRDGFDGVSLSAHNKKILDELTPYAVYLVDNAPFVLFYEELSNIDEQKKINRKIWNAQIPLTIVCGTGDVRIYNSCSINPKESAFDEIEHLLLDGIDENAPFSYWEITSQSFWRKYTKQFSGDKLNDHLLRNLSDITKKLREDYQVEFATKLTLRLIFIRYLIDRGVNLDYAGFSTNVDTSQKSFLRLLSDKSELYSLFLHLKGKFNGNLFELDNECDDLCLTADVLHVLSDFFSASIDTKTGQLSLFDLYDFNIIPVELISNIYEILLGKDGRDKDNAFYTPQYLVNYILDASISPFIRDNGACKVLDPSCGSGIFLVESYRRMVERELKGKLFADGDDLLQNILLENIYGVDLNEDAIDVAIFSLYLAVLDYKNPKTLEKFALPNLKGENLFVADFFDKDALQALENIPFSFIIGNPPWGSQKGLLVDYCKHEGYSHLLQNHDTCRAFILRSKDFSSTNPQCCFVLHSKMLYMQKGPSKKFREFLLKNTKITRIVELSSVRKLVFKNADAPAVVLTYSFSDDKPLENRFEYISMKPNLFFRLFNIVVVEKADIKYVPQKLLADNDWAWKTLVYGFSGDIDTILHVKNSFPNISEAINRCTPALTKSPGVKDNLGEQKDASHLIGRDFLASDAVDHFIIDMSKMSKFDKTHIDRPRDEKLFHAPYCLLLTGIDTDNYTMRAAFSDIDFVFRSAIYAIKGSSDQREFLLNLTGLFNSAFFSYLNLMIGSSLGVEREQRLITEVFDFPFVQSDSIVKQTELIHKMSKHEDFTVAPDVSSEIEKLNKMIIGAFELDDNPFIDYALNVQIPQLTSSNNSKAFQSVSAEQLKIYISPFLNAFSEIFSMSGRYVTANIYPNIAKHYSVVEIVLHDSKPFEFIKIVDEPTSTQAILTQFSAHKINDMFFEVKDVIHFEDDSFHIIKPNYYKNWHPAIAKMDLADAIDQILSRDGGND